MQFVDAETIHGKLDYPGLVESLRRIFREGVDCLERFSLSQPLQDGTQNSWIFLPAWQFGKVKGIKLVSVYPHNEKRGLASVQGVYLLFDAASGVPIACIDGVALTLRKTAANSALAATYLARQDSSTLLMVGAGELAPHLIEAHCTVRPIERVIIWNRTPERARTLVETLPESIAAMVDVTTDLDGSVPSADIISCATMSIAPLIKGALLKSGTHLDLVGGYRPDMREADDNAVRRARVFADARSTIEECGDIIQPIAAALLTESDITDTFQLARNERPGRQSADEITLFKSGGGGHEDLGAAQYLLSKLS